MRDNKVIQHFQTHFYYQYPWYIVSVCFGKILHLIFHWQLSGAALYLDLEAWVLSPLLVKYQRYFVWWFASTRWAPYKSSWSVRTTKKQVGRFLTIQRYTRVSFSSDALNFAEVVVNTVTRGGPTTEVNKFFTFNYWHVRCKFSDSNDLKCMFIVKGVCYFSNYYIADYHPKNREI